MKGKATTLTTGLRKSSILYPGCSSDSSLANFAGNFNLIGVCYAKVCVDDSWIIDIGAIDHMSSNKIFFSKLKTLKHSILIHHPDDIAHVS